MEISRKFHLYLEFEHCWLEHSCKANMNTVKIYLMNKVSQSVARSFTKLFYCRLGCCKIGLDYFVFRPILSAFNLKLATYP